MYLNGYATIGELLIGLTKYFAFYNGERPHQGLANRTREAVHQSAEGGGAMIVDKYAAMHRLPTALRSTGTAFDEDTMQTPRIPNTRTGAAPSSCVAIECNLN